MRPHASPICGVLFTLIAAGNVLAQGDVYSSRGAKDDRAKYVSKDGRWFDRCAYETDHMAQNPDTRRYGPPDHVPIDREIMKQYVRCAVDACAVNQKAVCWGRKSGPGDQFAGGGSPGGGFQGPADGSSGGGAPDRQLPNVGPASNDPCANPSASAGCPHLPFELPAEASPRQPIRVGISKNLSWGPWMDNLKRLIDKRRHTLLVNSTPAYKRQWENEYVRARATFTVYADGRIAVTNILTGVGANGTDPSYAQLVQQILTGLDAGAIGPFPTQINSMPLTWDFSEQPAPPPAARTRR